MRKFEWSKDNMKELFPDCPHKGFAKRCVSLVAHNCIDPAYHTCIIRPMSVRVNAVGEAMPEGYLRSKDYEWVEAPQGLREYLDSYRREERRMYIMNVYGQGWIVFLAREEFGILRHMVIRKVPIRGMPKAYALLRWIANAIETREPVGQDRESYTDDQDRESYKE